MVCSTRSPRSAPALHGEPASTFGGDVIWLRVIARMTERLSFGCAVAAFVTVKEGVATSPELADELKQHVVHKIGAIARPDDILFAADLPKTRSGKIMRRLLRDIAEGKALGDTTTLADPAVVARLKVQYQDEQG